MSFLKHSCREEAEEAAIALEEARIKALEERKQESHNMLVDVIKGKSASKGILERSFFSAVFEQGSLLFS